MGYPINSPEQAEVKRAALAAQYPAGPVMPQGKRFSRFAVERYAMGERPALWGIVVKWFYLPTAERPDLGKHEMGGAFVYFENGGVKLWNL